MATPLTKVLSVCLLGAACIAQASYPETTPNADTTAATQSTDVSALTSAIATSLDARDRRRGVEDLRPFYKARDYQSLWVATSFGRDRLRVLTRTVTDAQTEGLHPERYLLSSGVSASRSTDPEALARLELQATADLLRYVLDIRGLHPDSRAVRHRGAVKPESVDAAQLLGDAASTADLDAWLSRQAPGSTLYDSMRRALVQYRALRVAGGWPRVRVGKRIEPGDTDKRLPTIRKRLYATGDLLDADFESTEYDSELQFAVTTFQRRHGLAEDGIIGKRTQIAMGMPVDERIDQIAANMERGRWLPNDLGRRHVLVNVPQFELEVVEDGKRVMTMPIIVGKRMRRTPIFSGEITYLELNPYWNVPESIARKDLLPKLMDDPYHLIDSGLRLFDKSTREEVSREDVDFESVDGSYGLPFRMRQDPGPANALGRVKFMFKNPFAVYLHDTPARKLFDKPQRAFSSGCVRIERPIEMAEYLLQGNSKWSRPDIDDALDIGNRRRVELAEPVGVHLIYRTAWMGEDGRVQFRHDLYGRDKFLAEKLLATRAAAPATRI